LAATVVADTGFLVALLRERDVHRDWAAAVAGEFATPWHCCEPILTETFHLLPRHAAPALGALLQRAGVVMSFEFARHQAAVLGLMRKYADVPMSFADACIVRMAEVLPDPIVLTTDAHFRLYRRNGRQVIPCRLPA
jgi:uncharacterized protein